MPTGARSRNGPRRRTTSGARPTTSGPSSTRTVNGARALRRSAGTSGGPSGGHRRGGVRLREVRVTAQGGAAPRLGRGGCWPEDGAVSPTSRRPDGGRRRCRSRGQAGATAGSIMVACPVLQEPRARRRVAGAAAGRAVPPSRSGADRRGRCCAARRRGRPGARGGRLGRRRRGPRTGRPCGHEPWGAVRAIPAPEADADAFLAAVAELAQGYNVVLERGRHRGAAAVRGPRNDPGHHPLPVARRGRPGDRQAGPGGSRAARGAGGAGDAPRHRVGARWVPAARRRQGAAALARRRRRAPAPLAELCCTPAATRRHAAAMTAAGAEPLLQERVDGELMALDHGDRPARAPARHGSAAQPAAVGAPDELPGGDGPRSTRTWPSARWRCCGDLGLDRPGQPSVPAAATGRAAPHRFQWALLREPRARGGDHVNLPDVWGRSALGEAVDPVPSTPGGVRFQSLLEDLRRARFERRGGLARDVLGTLLYAPGAAHPSFAGVTLGRHSTGRRRFALSAWSPPQRWRSRAASAAAAPSSSAGAASESLQAGPAPPPRPSGSLPRAGRAAAGGRVPVRVGRRARARAAAPPARPRRADLDDGLEDNAWVLVRCCANTRCPPRCSSPQGSWAGRTPTCRGRGCSPRARSDPW